MNQRPDARLTMLEAAAAQPSENASAIIVFGDEPAPPNDEGRMVLRVCRVESDGNGRRLTAEAGHAR